MVLLPCNPLAKEEGVLGAGLKEEDGTKLVRVRRRDGVEWFVDIDELRQQAHCKDDLLDFFLARPIKKRRQ